MSIMQYFNLDSAPLPLAWNPSWVITDGWFDPSDSNTVFVGRTGTTPATAGSPVGQIKDKSGMGNHAVAPTDAARPTLVRMPATGRRNLLERTEEFAHNYWTKASVTLSDGSSPAAGIITATAVNGRIYKVVTTGQPVGTLVTNSIQVRRISGVGGVELVGPSNSPNLIDVTNEWKTFTVSGGQETYDYFVLSLRVVGDAVEFRSPQAELGSVATPYQKVTNAFDVTEAGVPDVWSLKFDGVDDALNVVLPKAINGFILIAGTKGTIIEPVSYAAGSTLSIGTTTYTGGTAGILSAVGGIIGVNLFDRNLTELERDLLIDYYKTKGAKGLLVAGPELRDAGGIGQVGTPPTLATYDPITGEAFVSRGGSTDQSFITFGVIPGVYHLEALNSGPGTIAARNGGPVSAAVSVITNGQYASTIFSLTSSLMTIAASANAASANFTVASLRELRAEEDWV